MAAQSHFEVDFLGRLKRETPTVFKSLDVIQPIKKMPFIVVDDGEHNVPENCEMVIVNREKSVSAEWVTLMLPSLGNIGRSLNIAVNSKTRLMSAEDRTIIRLVNPYEAILMYDVGTGWASTTDSATMMGPIAISGLHTSMGEEDEESPLREICGVEEEVDRWITQ